MREMNTNLYSGNLKERDNFGDLYIVGKIIKIDLKK
jgi:hypothetical protein